MENQSLTEKGEIDLAHFLAGILAETPDLAKIIEAWPRISLEKKQIIGKILE